MGKGKRIKRNRELRESSRPPALETTRRSPSLADLLAGSRAFVRSILPVLAIFFATRVLLAEAYRIPSGSMEPTLLVGDWLFVNKLRFGPHIPFTHLSLPGYAEPARGDVVVFVSPPQDVTIRI